MSNEDILVFGGSASKKPTLSICDPRDDMWMQNLAAEMNLSETAFLQKADDGYDLRKDPPSELIDAFDIGPIFVSRYFAPTAGIDEDPVTGSAHCCLGPYLSEKLGK